MGAMASALRKRAEGVIAAAERGGVMLQRFVLTGAPGSGKTTLLHALSERGHAVVAEAATDVIVAEQASGVDAPWEQDSFIDLVVAVQMTRQLATVPVDATVQMFDRSPLCTLALARYQRRPVTAVLAAEIARVVSEQVYQPVAFLVRPLGFVEHTTARRISYQDSLTFEVQHRQVYREHGFTLVDVPRGSLSDRVEVVESHLTATSTDAYTSDSVGSDDALDDA
jgi:predicted ATPase